MFTCNEFCRNYYYWLRGEMGREKSFILCTRTATHSNSPCVRVGILGWYIGVVTIYGRKEARSGVGILVTSTSSWFLETICRVSTWLLYLPIILCEQERRLMWKDLPNSLPKQLSKSGYISSPSTPRERGRLKSSCRSSP